MLKLKLQYFGHLMRRTDSFEKTLMLGKIEGRRRRGWQRIQWLAMVGWHHWLLWIWVWVCSGSWWWTGKPGVPQSMGSQRVGHDWATELNWTELMISLKMVEAFLNPCGSTTQRDAFILVSESFHSKANSSWDSGLKGLQYKVSSKSRTINQKTFPNKLLSEE